MWWLPLIEAMEWRRELLGFRLPSYPDESLYGHVMHKAKTERVSYGPDWVALNLESKAGGLRKTTLDLQSAQQQEPAFTLHFGMKVQTFSTLEVQRCLYCASRSRSI